MTETLTSTKLVTGLEGVVAAETRLSSVDGQAGELIIAGFPVEELAGQATFEETVYLLWHDRLPDAQELISFRAALAARRDLPPATLDLLRTAAAQRVAAIDALRMAAGTLSLQGADDPEQQALTLLASFPTIIAAYGRLLQGEEPLAPRPELGHAANYLFMLFGRTPSPEHVRGLETYLNTVVDHGMNASTFTARVIISTQSDLISAVVGALGALKGPLHGGAPGPALDMVFEIGDAANAERYLRRKLEQGERLMGFGHRIYKVRDPRAEVLSAAAARMFQGNGHQALYQLSRQVEQTAVALLAEYKPGRNLQTNVEFYTALLLHGLDLTTDLFTPTFAIGRVAGWIAHCFEQQQLNRIIRPQSVYVGPKDRSWTPLRAR
ncbi:MAG: citrate synthase/methylcitrate synthase [Anaerolineales bacterium]|nr:citrate synthase/methylcitrate synthase [Anaerolineales bacterium]